LAVESITLDDLDRAIVHALQLDGRVSFAVVADALSVSDQTVARRYRRLRAAGAVRVVGLPNSRRMGYVEWFVRLRCLPDGALPIARALAGRADVSWVMLTSAGTEITCLVRTRSAGERDALLLGTLPRTRQVVEMDAFCVLHTYFGGASGWNGRTHALSAAQIEQISANSPPVHIRGGESCIDLDADDDKILAVLARDGRTSAADIAATLGTSPSTATRRLDRLIATGAVDFDVEIAPHHLGYGVEALLWVTVDPPGLHETGADAAAHTPVALAVATSGTANLLLAVGCTSVDRLYQYVATDLARLNGVRAIHTAPIIRTVKRAGTLLDR
jgi:DNA-binding Lrp family transcriptional regulator